MKESRLWQILNLPFACSILTGASGADPVANAPDEFGQYMKDETAKWAKIVNASGAQAD